MSKTISINQALELQKKYFMPDIIKQHSINVTKVATFVSQKFVEKNLLDKELQLKIIISAILHDLTKLTDLKDFEECFVKENGENSEAVKFWRTLKKKYVGIRHELSVYEELKENYPEIANIIKSHGYFANEVLDKIEKIQEKLLYYGDLRDEFGKIVNLGNRLIISNKRYGYKNKTAEDWKKVIDFDNKALKFEEEIFSQINAIPEDCNKLNEIGLLDLLKKYNININQEIQG